MDRDTCCSNFQDVTDFSREMVNSLDEVTVDTLFSIVRFSTSASLVSDLSSAEQTLEVLDNLQYSGGLTNQAQAIQLCQESLQSSPNKDWKNMIVLITDGSPTSPYEDPKTKAQDAATDAKAAGTFIAPVLISPRFDFFTSDRLEFMKNISSDGNVLNVDNFDGLYDLKESLIGQILCQT